MPTDKATLSAITRNIYLSPAADRLERAVADVYVWGEVRISDFEIKTHVGLEGEFIALMSARFQATLDDMVEMLTIQTFPGHDEPGVPCDASWHYA